MASKSFHPESIFIWNDEKPISVFSSKFSRGRGQLSLSYPTERPNSRPIPTIYVANSDGFTKKFEMDNQGKRDWYSARPKGDELYAWIAREEEYKGKNDIGKYLRENGDIKTISEIEKENKIKEMKLVGSLTNVLSMKEKQCEEIKKNISNTERYLSNVMRQKEDVEKVFNQDKCVSSDACNPFKWQKQKDQLRQKIIELERQLNDKQRLELEIEQMKGAVEVTKHFGGYRDVKAKIKSIEENLKEKEDELENLEELNQALIIKERKTNDEVQDARKELINGLKDMLSANASVDVKRMRDLDEKPIHAAAKKKYPAAEAGEKAMEFASVLDKKLRDPSWHAFKVMMVGEDHKEVKDEEDDFLKTLRSEWDYEVYRAVITALTEMNQYKPSGRYPVPELWKIKEGKRATLGDSVDFIVRLWKLNKRKRK